MVIIANNTVYILECFYESRFKCSHPKKELVIICRDKIISSCYGGNHFAVHKYTKSSYCTP